MPQPSEYHADDGKVYVPRTFVAAFNEHSSIHAAAKGMAMEPKRLSVIASRLRRRGFEVRRFDDQRYR